MTSITSLCELACQVAQKKLKEKQIEEEQAAKAKYWKLAVCYDDDDDEEISNSLDDNIISGLPLFSAITPDEPVLSTKEPDNSLSIGDEHLDTISATESDEFIKSGVENLIPILSESEGIPDHRCDVPHDNSPPLDVSHDQIEDFSESNKEFSSTDDDSFSIDDIDYVEASPPDSELVSSETKSSSTSLNSLLEETNTFDNSLPEFETFCFDVEEISSGSTTISPDLSLPEYEAFHDDHVEPNSRDFTKDVVKDISPMKEPQLLNTLPTHPTLQLNMKFPLDVSNDQIEDFSESNKEFSSIDDDSFSIDNIDYVKASPSYSELVSSEVMEIVILETKSSSTSLNSLLEETNTSNNSLPEFKTFCFDVKEISSGSTTTPPDISLPEYEAFYDDHVKEISSGSTTTPPDISLPEYEAFYDDHVKEISSRSPTTHYDSPLYASFMFDLSINPFPPADRSDSYEFTDELIPFISASEYDCFLFKVEPNSRDFTKDVVEDISPMKEPQVLNALPTHPSFQLNTKFQPSSESLFAYVVWIFLPFLVYSVAPHYLLSLQNEDIIFDPGICKSIFSRPDISHRLRKLKKGQNRIKTGQKREAWRSQEKSKAVTVDRARKTKENAKRRAGNANTVKALEKKEKKRVEITFT
nr:hypothetical protein [Tanacetum cinerariifolium]